MMIAGKMKRLCASAKRQRERAQVREIARKLRGKETKSTNEKMVTFVSL